ncbi:hypothetical protein GQ53DRAFT_118711 [Thozetella sp. PMI_491]|nr:hypothetical protein GQ53DRAFT_118711 [Thozetella sp. PMI_491]
MIPLFIQASHGLGHHQDTISEPDLLIFNQLSFVQSIVPLIGGIALLKIAIALEILKLLKSTAWKWYTIILWSLIGFVCAYTFMAWMTFFLFCQPLALIWDHTLEGHCYSIDLFVTFGLVNTGFNIFTDVAFATLPVPVIWNLKMHLRTRIYLIAVLSLGYVAVIMGIIKAVYQIAFSSTVDFTFNYDVQFWGLMQLNLGITAACAPSLKPLVGSILNLKSLTPKYNYPNSGAYGTPGRSGRGTGARGVGTAASRGYIKQNSNNDGLEEFELRDRRLHGDHAGAYSVSAKGPNSPELSHSDGASRDRAGSEESILAGTRDSPGKGIFRTTEVTVTY